MMAGYIQLQHRRRLEMYAELLPVIAVATQGSSKQVNKLRKKLEQEGQ